MLYAFGLQDGRGKALQRNLLSFSVFLEENSRLATRVRNGVLTQTPISDRVEGLAVHETLASEAKDKVAGSGGRGSEVERPKTSSAIF